MADVTKSLEIILSAKDLTGAVFAGLKQSISLAASPLDSLADSLLGFQKRVADYLDSGMFKLAQIGGAYQEQANQFAAYAAAQSKNGASILNTIDRIAGGTLAVTDRLTIASRALASGLNTEQFETALTYVKRFTESTGQDFQSMAESVFAAMSSGRYSVLKQMGLFIEEGASASDVINQMRAGLGQFADTGFNFADSVEAINNDISDFITYIGAALNKSGSFQRMTQYAAEAIDEFVKSFNYDAAAYFFDGIIRSAEIVYSALGETFGGIYGIIRDTFGRLGTSSGATDFFKSIALQTIEAARYFPQFAQYVSDAFQSVVWAGGKAAEFFGEFYAAVKHGGLEFAAAMTGILTRPIMSAAQAIQELIAASPMLANAWGADAIGAGLGALQSKIAAANAELRKMASDALFENNIGMQLQEFGKEFADQLASSSSTFSDSFDAIAAKIKAGFEKFKLPEIEKPKEQDLEAARKAAEALAKIRAEAERAQAENEAKKTQGHSLKLIEQRTKAETEAEDRALKDRKATLEARLRDIQKVLKGAELGKGEIYKVTLGVDLNALRQEQTAIETALGKINIAEANALQQSAAQALEVFKQTDFKVANYLNTYGSIFKDGKGELDIKHKEQLTEGELLEKLFSRVSWPAALQDLAKAVIAAVVAQMRGERLPLVLTTAA